MICNSYEYIYTTINIIIIIIIIIVPDLNLATDRRLHPKSPPNLPWIPIRNRLSYEEELGPTAHTKRPVGREAGSVFEAWS